MEIHYAFLDYVFGHLRTFTDRFFHPHSLTPARTLFVGFIKYACPYMGKRRHRAVYQTKVHVFCIIWYSLVSLETKLSFRKKNFCSSLILSGPNTTKHIEGRQKRRKKLHRHFQPSNRARYVTYRTRRFFSKKNFPPTPNLRRERGQWKCVISYAKMAYRSIHLKNHAGITNSSSKFSSWTKETYEDSQSKQSSVIFCRTMNHTVWSGSHWVSYQ